ncbi:MAG: exodeoxyribonuclease V subunit gamma [Clostridia bacterium]|nr:exodeoxyribonuclease V subunit gamma [Clostridia bacterium]
MLQLILGPAHSGKTQHLYQELKNRLDTGETSWILVPEQFSLFTEKEIISRFGLPAQKQIKVLSFARLCNLVLHELGPLRMQYIDGAGKHILATRALDLLKDKLTFLKQNLRQKGFSKVLADTLSECKRYGVSPQTLQFAAENTKNPELSRKLDELSILFETYNNLINAHHADAEDNLTLICPRIRNCSFLQGKLFVRHFRSFTPVEHQVLGELMQKMDLSVLLDTSDQGNYGGIFSPVEGTLRKLRESAMELGIEENAPIVLTPAEPTNALTYLQQNYFNFRAKPLDETTNSVFLYEAQNRYREVETAADLILRLCRTESYRFRDFLILARNTDSYSRILPSIFKTRSIPVFLDTKERLSSKPLLRLLFGTLDILAYGHSYERMMTIARSEILPLSRGEVDRLENYILATAPTHAMWQAPVWDYLPSSGEYDLEEINATKTVLLSGVEALQKSISGRKTGGEIAAALLNWLKESGLSQRVTDLAQEALDNGDTALSESYQQSWNATLSILAQLSAMMEDTPMTYQRFAELFEETCLGTEIGRTPQTLDCVIVSQIDRFRSSGAKVVLVLDLTEGVFPKGYSTEGFLSDNERHLLKELGLELAPGLESKQREEQLLIYAVLTASTEKLFLLRPLFDNDGGSYQASGIVKRTKELLPQVNTINPDTTDDPLAGAEGTVGAFSLLATALADCSGDASRLSPPLQELYGWFRQSPKHKDNLAKLEKAMTALPPTAISKEMATALYGAPLKLSASQLETYNSCAFRYFLTYGLLVRERDLAGIEPRSMGSIQHAALYRYFTDLKAAGTDFADIQKEDCFRSIGAAIEAEAKENSSLLYEASSYYQYIVLRMKDIAARTAWEVVKFYRSSRFRPYGFEITIGTKGPIPALSVKDPDGTELAKIRGIIDRADTAVMGDKTLVSIVDYKSSAKDLDITLAKDGITLQPLLYANALCHSMKDATPAAMFYLQMNDPIIPESDVRGDLELAVDKKMKPKGWIVEDPDIQAAYAADGEDTFIPKERATFVTRKDLSERIAAANQKIQESAKDIAGGIIGANPYRSYKHDACAYCMYHGICQKHG